MPEVPCRYLRRVHGPAMCSICQAGKHSLARGLTCAQRPAGTYSSDQATTCTNCAAGYFARNGGSKSCGACAAGRYSQEAATKCINCAAGKYNGNTGQGACNDCAAGKAAVAGSLSCTACGAGPTAGAAQCSSCRDGTISTEVHLSVPLVPPESMPTPRLTTSASCQGQVPRPGGIHLPKPPRRLHRFRRSPASPAYECQTAVQGMRQAITPTRRLPPPVQLVPPALIVQPRRPSAPNARLEPSLAPLPPPLAGHARSESIPAQAPLSAPTARLVPTLLWLQRMSATSVLDTYPHLVPAMHQLRGRDAVNTKGSVTCADCEAGKYAGTEGSSSCTECVRGSTTNDLTGQKACIPCPVGQFAFLAGTACAHVSGSLHRHSRRVHVRTLPRRQVQCQ